MDVQWKQELSLDERTKCLLATDLINSHRFWRFVALDGAQLSQLGTEIYVCECRRIS